MTHGDVTITCIGRGFYCSRLRQSYLNYRLAQFSFNNLKSVHTFDGSRSGAMKKYCSHCKFAYPWTIETSVQRCSGPGPIRIHVVCIGEHRSNSRARGPESGVGETDASISE